MTTYRSKIGSEFVIPIGILVGGIGIIMAYERVWIGLAFILLVIAFIAHMLLTTYYEIDEKHLRVKCGFFVDTTIDPGTIKEIKETNSFISSPAASLSRLLVLYNKYDSIIISPKDKNGFIHQLMRINPNIKLTLKTQPGT